MTNYSPISFIYQFIDTNSGYATKLLKQLKPLDKQQLQIQMQSIQKCVDLLNQNPHYFDQILNDFYYIKDISLILTNLKEGIILHETELFEIKYFIKYALKINSQFALDSLKLLPMPTILGNDEGFELNSPQLSQIISKKNKQNHLELSLLQSQEELKIRTDLSKKLQPFALALQNNLTNLALTELTIQKAIMAKKHNMCPVNNANSIEFIQLKNPNIQNCVGVDCVINCGTSVISGANMGGKSTFLQTLYQNITLYLHGFYVFAQKFCCPYLDFTRLVTNEQKPNLSTFASQVVQANQAFEMCLNNRGLVLIDELAFGTNPDEAKKIFVAFLQAFNQTNSFAILTTHLSDVANHAQSHYQITQNYNLTKTHLNAKIPQYAIKICKDLALNKHILDKLL